MGGRAGRAARRHAAGGGAQPTRLPGLPGARRRDGAAPRRAGAACNQPATGRNGSCTCMHLPAAGPPPHYHEQAGHDSVRLQLDAYRRMVRVPPGQGGAPARLLRLLRARPAALGSSALPGEEASPLGAQPLPRVLELAASKPADSTAFDPPGTTCTLRRGPTCMRPSDDSCLMRGTCSSPTRPAGTSRAWGRSTSACCIYAYIHIYAYAYVIYTYIYIAGRLRPAVRAA